MDGGAWRAFSPWGHQELDTTEHACEIWSILLMENLKYFFQLSIRQTDTKALKFHYI